MISHNRKISNAPRYIIENRLLHHIGDCNNRLEIKKSLMNTALNIIKQNTKQIIIYGNICKKIHYLIILLGLYINDIVKNDDDIKKILEDPSPQNIFYYSRLNEKYEICCQCYLT